MKKIKRIAIDSPCLGDTIAWMPLIDKYRKVNDYDCLIYTSDAADE